jgi:hypothetical protein
MTINNQEKRRTMDFNAQLHQKVTYRGTDQQLKRSPLYVVVKSEFPNLYLMKPDEEVVIHIINKFDQVIHNSDSAVRNHYTVKKSHISFEGDLYKV